MIRRLALLLAGLALAGSAIAASIDGRFTQSIPSEERAAIGLGRLDSDQLASLDALVRRDASQRGSLRADPKAPALFSQRLNADERKLTGLAALPAEELARLDASVERYEAAALARTLLAPPSYAPRVLRAEPVERKKQEREIHGSFMLSFGWGSGGYSERTGAAEFTLEDPARRYSITIGYSETHVKGGDRYRMVELPERP